MNKRIKIGLAVVAVLMVSVVRPNRAYSDDVYFGNFDDMSTYNLINSYSDPNRTGWYDFGGSQVSADTSTTIGVTTGTQSLAWQPGSVGYYQGLTYKLQIDPRPAAERDTIIQGMLANTHLAMNITWDRNEWVAQHNGDINSSNFSSVQLVVNYGPSGSFTSLGAPSIDTGNSNFPGGWDPVNYTTPTHTRVVEWDYSSLKPAIQALYDAGTTTGTNGWLEFILVTNAGDYNYPITYYLDSYRFTTPSAPGDYNNDGKVDAADYVLWRKNDINGAQGYTDWRTNFGTGTAGAGSGSLVGAAVPEPSACMLFVAAVGLLGWRRSARQA
jgi:hypothetical protein